MVISVSPPSPKGPNDSFAELRQVYAGDDRLRVPPAVRNAVRQRDEVR